MTDLVRSGKLRAIGSSSFPASEIVEAQWVAKRRGLARFRTGQPPYSPVCQRYGMGTLVWSPLAMGLLTGRYRKHRPDDVSTARRHWVPRHMSDERTRDVVERLVPVAEESGLSLTHMAPAFTLAHPGVTSSIIDPPGRPRAQPGGRSRRVRVAGSPR